MFRFAWMLGLVAILTQLLVPAVVRADNCRTIHNFRVVGSSIVQIEPEVIAVPVVFFQFVNQAASRSSLFQSTPKVNADLDRLDQFIKDRVEVALRDAIHSTNRDIPMVYQVPTAPTPKSNMQSLLDSMQLRCASCHTAPNVKGQVTIFNEQNELAPDIDYETIVAAVTKDANGKVKMPPAARGNPLSIHALPIFDVAILRQLASRN